MKISPAYFSCFILMNLLVFGASAQEKDNFKKEPKFRPPVVKTFLGKNQNGAKVTADEASQLVGVPLKIADDKNNTYKVISYQFLYRQKSYVLNDETGKKEVSFTIVSDRFDVTPLPKLWIDNIKGRLQTDEQLYFFDIVVSDSQGRQFFAPELKITVR